MQKAYSKLCKNTIKNGNFCFAGGEKTGTCRFLSSNYGLGGMPNKFLRARDSFVKDVPFCNEFVDVFFILIASKTCLDKQKAISLKLLEFLINKKTAVKKEQAHS